VKGQVVSIVGDGERSWHVPNGFTVASVSVSSAGDQVILWSDRGLLFGSRNGALNEIPQPARDAVFGPGPDAATVIATDGRLVVYGQGAWKTAEGRWSVPVRNASLAHITDETNVYVYSRLWVHRLSMIGDRLDIRSTFETRPIFWLGESNHSVTINGTGAPVEFAAADPGPTSIKRWFQTIEIGLCAGDTLSRSSGSDDGWQSQLCDWQRRAGLRPWRFD
jgi:hypothetical protein